MSANTTAPDVGEAGVVVRPGWHPAVDEFGDGFVVFATPDRLVLFTEAFASFIAEAAARGVRPVLLTSLNAQVSAQVSLAMRGAGGMWAVQGVDGATFDALSGYRIAALAQLWARPDTTAERMGGYDEPAARWREVVTFDVHAHQHINEQTRIGVIAQALARTAGHTVECFGTREPLLEPWSLSAVTEAARGVMPESQTLRLAGSGGLFGQVQVARTPTGLLEHTILGVPMPGHAPGRAVVDLVTAGLEGIAERFGVTVAFAAVMRYDQAGSDVAPLVVQGASVRPPEAPVAVLVGPRGVRDLGVDFAELGQSHDVRRLGRAKTPSMLVRFIGADKSLWRQVADFAAALGPANIANAAGLKAGV